MDLSDLLDLSSGSIQHLSALWNCLLPRFLRRHGFFVTAPAFQNKAPLRSRQLSSQWHSGRLWWAGCSPTARVGYMDALAGYVCLCFSMYCPSYKIVFSTFVLPKIGIKLVSNKLCVRKKMNEKGKRDFLCLEIIWPPIAVTFSFMYKYNFNCTSSSSTIVRTKAYRLTLS